jgi:hypothetical protein
MSSTPDPKPDQSESTLKLKVLAGLPIILVFAYFLWRATRY